MGMWWCADACVVATAALRGGFFWRFKVIVLHKGASNWLVSTLTRSLSMDHDLIQSLYYLADLAGGIAIGLEDDASLPGRDWDHLHALLFALRALAASGSPGAGSNN